MKLFSYFGVTLIPLKVHGEQSNFVEICSPIPEKTILKGFYHKCARRPSWSCHLDFFILVNFTRLDVAVR